MNGKIPNNNTNWVFSDLVQYGFSAYKYYKFKNKLSEAWFYLFGDRIFKVTKILYESKSRMDYENYSIIIDEMGYVDVIYNGTSISKIPYEIILSGRREITMVDMFDAIKHHRRGIRLKSLENELV